MADYSPVYANGVAPYTATTSAAVVGATLLEASTTGAVATAGALSLKCVGVAAHDAPSGGRVTVWPLSGVVHEIVHTAGGTVGDTIVAAASGLLGSATPATAAAAGYDLGIALTTAGAAAKLRFIGK
jgi:hypothetical protein